MVYKYTDFSLTPKSNTMNLLIVVPMGQIQQASTQKGLFLWICILLFIVVVVSVCVMVMKSSCHRNNPLPEEVSDSRQSISLLNVNSGSWVEVWHFNQTDLLMSHAGKRPRFQCTFGGNLSLYEELSHYEVSEHPQRVQVFHERDVSGIYTTHFKRSEQKEVSELFV